MDDNDEGEEGADLIKQAADYDPVEHLSSAQIHTVMRLVMFPREKNHKLAKAVGVTSSTIVNWKRDPHFIELLNREKAAVVRQSMETYGQRLGGIYDALTDEVLSRTQKPVRDQQELEKILGPNYTNEDQKRYEERFITNIPAEKLLRVWNQFDTKIRQDAGAVEQDSSTEKLIETIRAKHTKLRQVRIAEFQFEERTGFNYFQNIHDDPPGSVIDIKVESAASDDAAEDILDAYSMEKKDG